MIEKDLVAKERKESSNHWKIKDGGEDERERANRNSTVKKRGKPGRDRERERDRNQSQTHIVRARRKEGWRK